MFTGLIEGVGEVLTFELIGGGGRLVVATPLAAELTDGESIAVNGACLTAVERTEGEVAFDLGPETLRATALGELTPGARVNLERAVRADARLGGHFVLGHVDAVGTITAVQFDGEFQWLSVSYPRDLAPYLVPKGSIAVDGISLTIAVLDTTSFDVQVVQLTLARTNLSAARVGRRVNLEADVIGKYVARAVALGVSRAVEHTT